MLIVHSALGYCVLLVIAYLSGRRTRSIPWKTIGMATVLQLLLAAILLQPAIRSLVFSLASDLTTLLKTTKAPLLVIPVKLSGTSGVIYYLAETKSR